MNNCDLESEYINIKTLEFAGFRSAFEALRLPFGKECRTESYSHLKVEYLRGLFEHSTEVLIDNNDLDLLRKLCKNGDEHAKVLRGIVVYAEISAPRYWWVEMDTYRIGTERLSSESTMHIQGKGLATEELLQMKAALPEGTVQKRIQMFSYQTLRRIFYQRRYHRLPHWQEFCKWICRLPFAAELIINKD